MKRDLDLEKSLSDENGSDNPLAIRGAWLIGFFQSASAYQGGVQLILNLIGDNKPNQKAVSDAVSQVVDGGKKEQAENEDISNSTKP